MKRQSIHRTTFPSRLSLFVTTLLIALTAMTACTTTDDTDETATDDEYVYEGWGDEIIPDTTGNKCLSVAEAYMAPVGEVIYMSGYIIGSASRNLSSTICAPPFESRSSLILADKVFKPGDKPGEYDAFYEDDLFPVCLTDFQDTQKALNLVDHPEHWHRRIYLVGLKSTYMGVPGLRKILQYQFAE